MFATLETRSPTELATESWFLEGYALIRLGDNRATTLAFWAETADVMAYALEADRPWSDQPATAAAIASFDGPMSPARVAAARYGFDRRIEPALAAVPGLVRSLVLWREHDAASCTVTLAVDLAAIEAAGAAINATTLLPGEDPALLTGPDRVDIHHLVTPVTGVHASTRSHIRATAVREGVQQ